MVFSFVNNGCILVLMGENGWGFNCWLFVWLIDLNWLICEIDVGWGFVLDIWFNWWLFIFCLIVKWFFCFSCSCWVLVWLCLMVVSVMLNLILFWSLGRCDLLRLFGMFVMVLLRISGVSFWRWFVILKK